MEWGEGELGGVERRANCSWDVVYGRRNLFSISNITKEHVVVSEAIHGGEGRQTDM